MMNLKLTESESSKLSILVIILTINLALGFPMGVFGGVITAHERFAFRNAVSVAREILMPIVILLFLHFGFKSVALVTINAIFNITVLTLDFLYARTRLHYHPAFVGFDKGVVKEIVSYTIFIFIGEVTDRISNATNSTILAAFSGTTAIAVFSVGAQLYSYYLNFSASISSYFFPRVVGMTVKQASNQEVSDLFIKVGRIQLYVIALIFSGFVAFGQNFIHLWMGDGYAEAYWIAVICMAPTIIGRSQSLGVQVLLARNKHQFRAIFYVLVALLDIAISIPLGIKYAGVGVAVGTAVAQIVGPVITMNIYYARVIGLDIMRYWKNVIPMLVGIGVLSCTARFLNSICFAEGWFSFIGQIVLYIIAYAAMIFFIFFNSYEKELVLGLVNKIKRKA